MTSRRPYWCSKTMKRRPCWCTKKILGELNSFLVPTQSIIHPLSQKVNMQYIEVLHNAHPKRNIGSAKRNKPSEVKSGTSTFAPSLTTAIIFRRAGSHDLHRKRGLHLPMGEDKLVKVQGCSHKINTRREYKCLQTTERLIYLFI